MAQTSGGLIKTSLQLTRGQRGWLRRQARLRGGASIAAVVRELIASAMAAERRSA